MSFRRSPTNLTERERAMDVLTRLDEARAATNVLEHPFYQRWTEGCLTAAELSLYAGQYRHAVVALAAASTAAAEAATAAGHPAAAPLRRHAQEEAAHVSLWDSFAGACSSPEDAPPLEGTRECVSEWNAGEDLLERLAVLYAIEASQPEISKTKLEGLRRHYDHVQEGPATEYFSLHEQLDVEHAAEARTLIGALIAEAEHPEERAQRMVARADAALRGNWHLLDSVEETAAAS
jgi:pyrroloquinoline-quinone synthase